MAIADEARKEAGGGSSLSFAAAPVAQPRDVIESADLTEAASNLQLAMAGAAAAVAADVAHDARA